MIFPLLCFDLLIYRDCLLWISFVLLCLYHDCLPWFFFVLFVFSYLLTMIFFLLLCWYHGNALWFSLVCLLCHDYLRCFLSYCISYVWLCFYVHHVSSKNFCVGVLFHHDFFLIYHDIFIVFEYVDTVLSWFLWIIIIVFEIVILVWFFACVYRCFICCGFFCDLSLFYSIRVFWFLVSFIFCSICFYVCCIMIILRFIMTCSTALFCPFHVFSSWFFCDCHFLSCSCYGVFITSVVSCVIFGWFMVFSSVFCSIIFCVVVVCCHHCFDNYFIVFFWCVFNLFSWFICILFSLTFLHVPFSYALWLCLLFAFIVRF